MNYTQINIGRNIDNVPMTETQWLAFQTDVARIISGNVSSHTPIETHYGTGEWDGIPEESAHLSALSDDTFNIAGIRSELATLKTRYMQESIALIVSSELV